MGCSLRVLTIRVLQAERRDEGRVLYSSRTNGREMRLCGSHRALSDAMTPTGMPTAMPTTAPVDCARAKRAGSERRVRVRWRGGRRAAHQPRRRGGRHERRRHCGSIQRRRRRGVNARRRLAAPRLARAAAVLERPVDVGVLRERDCQATEDRQRTRRLLHLGCRLLACEEGRARRGRGVKVGASDAGSTHDITMSAAARATWSRGAAAACSHLDLSCRR